MSLNHTAYDTIIYNGIVLTIDNEMTVYKQGYVAIQGTKIVRVAELQKGENLPTAQSYVDADGGIIMPGFVNPHTHIPLTCFRGMGDDIPNRLIRYIFPLERDYMTADVVKTCSEHAILESFAAGVTCLADMYYFEKQVAQACHDASMRAITGQTLMSRPAPDFNTFSEALDTLPPLLEYCNDSELVTPALAPHAPYTLEHDDLKTVAELSEQHELPVLMHVAETKKECEVVAERSQGQSPVQYLNDLGLINHRMVAGHCLYMDDNDWDIFVENDAGAVHNMSANLKSAKGRIMSLSTAVDKNARVGIGTDGPISGNTIDVIGQLHMIAKVQKFINDDASLFPCADLVRMATLGGARSLHMDDKIGSLEVGKEADIIIIGLNHPRMLPIYDPYTVLVYSAQASDVQATFVAGRMVYKNGTYYTLDKELILKKANDIFCSYANSVGLSVWN